MKIYLAGPMAGLPDHNFPAFAQAAKLLRCLGHEVINPADLTRADDNISYMHCIKRDLKHLLDCDQVVFLPGWTKSRGANIEHQVATLTKIPRCNLDWFLLQEKK